MPLVISAEPDDRLVVHPENGFRVDEQIAPNDYQQVATQPIKATLDRRALALGRSFQPTQLVGCESPHIGLVVMRATQRDHACRVMVLSFVPRWVKVMPGEIWIRAPSHRA